MRIISRSTLRSFWQRHRKAKTVLECWYRTVRQATWSKFADVRRTFSSADTYKKGSYTYVIFNVGGNKFRIIAKIEYKAGLVFVGMVLTHAEYDMGKWKDLLPKH